MYVLAKSVLALMIGFIASVVLGLVFIPWLRKLKVGQKTSVFVKAHEKKSGTPTMGGIIFIPFLQFYFCVLLINLRYQVIYL